MAAWFGDGGCCEASWQHGSTRGVLGGVGRRHGSMVGGCRGILSGVMAAWFGGVGRRYGSAASRVGVLGSVGCAWACLTQPECH
jgi:hypothetical protein